MPREHPDDFKSRACRLVDDALDGSGLTENQAIERVAGHLADRSVILQQSERMLANRQGRRRAVDSKHTNFGPIVQSRRVFALAFGAFALIFGILAMHGTLGDSHSVAMTMSSAVVDADLGVAHADMTPMSTHASDCAEPCGDPVAPASHTTMLTMCVLALMGAVLAIFAPALESWLPLFVAMLLATIRRARPTVIPRPPSLVALSISRT